MDGWVSVRSAQKPITQLRFTLPRTSAIVSRCCRRISTCLGYALLIFDRFRDRVALMSAEQFAEIAESLSAKYQPIFRPALKLQADLLDFNIENLTRQKPKISDVFGSIYLHEAEVFTDGSDLYALTIEEQTRSRLSTSSGKLTTEIWLYYLSSSLDRRPVEEFIALANQSFNVDLKYFPRMPLDVKKFWELKADGRESPPPLSEQDMAAVELLSDDTTRTVARQIKALGGLLVSDIAKQLPIGSRNRAERSRRLCGRRVL
jgi:hypothetical protein